MNVTNTVTPAQLRQAVVSVLDYLWHDERADFLRSTPAERAEHIFAALTILAHWLGKTDAFPGD